MSPSLAAEASNLTMATTQLESPLIVKKTNGSLIETHTKSSVRKNVQESSIQGTAHASKYSNNNSQHHYSSDQQVMILSDTISTTKKSFCSHFDSWSESNIDVSTIEGFLEYIEHERLTHIPHRGSTLDRVLKWAEYFAIQVSGYAKAVSPFLPGSQVAAKLIWEASRTLLELGPENDQALEPTFNAFYKMGLSLAFFLRYNDLFYGNSHIRREIGEAFNDMLILVSCVSVHYKKTIRGLSGNAVILNFNQRFGAMLTSFYQRKTHIVEFMWKYKLADRHSLDVRTIRKWLSPVDASVKMILRNRKEASEFRTEYTFEWFQRYLLDFSRSSEKLLAITAPVGCGKTYLSSWIVERLQRPLGRKSHQVISCSVYADIANQSTCLAIAQNLSLQLLEVNVGDADFFNGLTTAYELSKVSNDANVEEALWMAIDTGLTRFGSMSDNLMVVIDGLDELKGGKDAITSRFYELALKHKNIRVILLSRSLPSTNSNSLRHIAITPDMTHNDLEQVLRRSFSTYHCFSHLEEHSQESIVEKLVHHSKGSFLFATLVAERLKTEKTHKGFTGALNDIPKTLDDMLKSVFASLDLSHSELKTILAWTLIAERPLSIGEFKSLLSVDTKHKAIVVRMTTLMEDLDTAKSVLNITGGYVSFRHAYIRSYIQGLQADKKNIFDVKEAQKDFTLRLLAYCRFLPGLGGALAFEQPSLSSVFDRFKSHQLMEYASRNWTLHFRQSSIWKETGNFEHLSELKALLPTSPEFALMEWTCWDSQFSKSDAISMHKLALRIRTDVFSEKHESVLQTLIICGNLYLSISKTSDAAKYFYQASVMGQTVLLKYSSLTMDCTTRFLTCTENIKITRRSEDVTMREEMLRYIITAYKHTHGETSDIVISYYKVLASLYVQIKEEHNAEIIWREMHEVITKRYGKGSEEEASITRELVLVLKKEHHEKDVVAYDYDIFQSTKKLAIWDIRRIETTLKLALSYEARSEMFLAEELYITLWTQLTQHCHHSHLDHGIELYISIIDVALEYVRFLRRCHRHEEASNILICVWEEYEDYEFDSEVIFLNLKIVGELMRAVNLLTIAISVFKKCVMWFASHDKHEHISLCEILIKETVEEIIQTTTTTTVTTTTESIVEEILESTIRRATVTSESIAIFQSLISFYVKAENWAQAIFVTEKTLTLIWKMIISGSGTCALPKRYDSDAIDIALCLADCHFHAHNFHEAEEIYLRIYRASSISCHDHIADERLTKSYTALTEFYERKCHWEKMITIHKAMLSKYRQSLGVKHTLTIQTLYVLGKLCSNHGFGHGYEYYEEIVTVCNGTGHICHNDAKEAMIFLCRYYHENGYWTNLKNVCQVLWATWTHHHHEYKFDATFLELLYQRYSHVLEHQLHCDYEVLRKLTIEYRDTCINSFSSVSVISIKAMLALAEVCMRSSKCVHEAVQIYTEIITKTTTTTTTTTTIISEETLKKVKEQLSIAYVTLCSHESVSTATIEKAIKVLGERLEYLKIQMSCAHPSTLAVLQQLVSLHWKLRAKDCHTTVIKIIQNTIVEICMKEKYSKTLHEAAITIGRIYQTCELQSHGLDVLAEIRRQIITKNFTSSKKYGFKVDLVGKSSFVFIITLEKVLRGSLTINYSELMTELLTESTLYEHYRLCLKSENTITIITQASKLRAFLIKRHREEEVKLVESHTFELFNKRWGATFKTQNRGILMAFYSCILTELASESYIHFGNAVCVASNTLVLEMMSKSKAEEAYEVAKCAFHFIDSQGAVKHLQNISYMVKLSSYMVNRGMITTSVKTIPPELSGKMIELSKSIIKVVFKTCKEHDISFVRLQLSALNNLVGLLGAQHNYKDLENLLETLWRSREVQKNWNATTTLSVGLRLIQAYQLAEQPAKALRLCEDICYNLRRVWGSLSPTTLRMQGELSELYDAKGHYREAMAIHEDILRMIVEGDDGDDRTQDTVDAAAARNQIELLKRFYLRFKGWDKSEATYTVLVDDIISMYKGHECFSNVTGVPTWSLEEEDDNLGKFSAPDEWKFASKEDIEENEHPKRIPVSTSKTRPGLGIKRASSNWGLGTVHRLLFGEHDGGVVMNEGSNIKANGNSNGQANGKVMSS